MEIYAPFMPEGWNRAARKLTDYVAEQVKKSGPIKGPILKRIFEIGPSKLEKVVELTGIEPVASSLRIQQAQLPGTSKNKPN